MAELYPVPDHIAPSNARVWRYQHTVIAKQCIECGRSFQEIRVRKGICSDECKAIRRARFRPATFINCKHCGSQFGPIGHLKVQYCSRECAYADRGGRTKKTVATQEARNAQRTLAYHVQIGKVIRPTVCEECGCTNRKIEGAHIDYSRPLDVRWLCRSCHVKWDKADPKGGAYSVPIDETFTGKTAVLAHDRAMAAD